MLNKRIACKIIILYLFHYLFLLFFKIILEIDLFLINNNKVYKIKFILTFLLR
jgi:hypothetical protein